MKPSLLLPVALAIFALKAFAAMLGFNLVKDIAPGAISGIPDFSKFYAVGNTLLFAATEKTQGNELWRSDGTSAGTTLVKDIFPGGRGSDPSGPVVFN